jgi:hypothetical protein
MNTQTNDQHKEEPHASNDNQKCGAKPENERLPVIDSAIGTASQSRSANGSLRT